MIAQTHYAKLTRVTWKLDPIDVTRAIREYIERHGPFAKSAHAITSVELTEDGGAEAEWVKEEGCTDSKDSGSLNSGSLTRET